MRELIASSSLTKVRRIIMVICGVVGALFTAGLIFGNASLNGAYLSHGVFSFLCQEEDYSGSSNEGYGDILQIKEKGSCEAQKNMLEMLLIIASSVMNIGGLVFGTTLDKLGPKWNSILGAFLVSVGCVLLSFGGIAGSNSWDYLCYLGGYIALSLGGPCIYISSLHLAAAFPTHSGVIVGFLTGAFDASCSIFLFLQMMYDAGVSLQTIFLAYLVVPGFIVLSQIIVFPSASLTFEDVGDNGKTEKSVDFSESKEHLTTNTSHEDDIDIIVDDDDDDDDDDSEDEKSSNEKSSNESNKKKYSLAGLNLKQQYSSREFWLITLFMCIMMLKMNFYMSSITTRFPGSRSHLVKFFNYALPIGGLVSIPVIGVALKHFSASSALVLVFGLNLICCILELLHDFDIPQYIGISLFSVVRPLLYATCSEFCAKIFGFKTFGRVYGSVFLFSGLFNLNNYWIKMIVASSSGNDGSSMSYFMADLIMSIATFLVLLCPYYVWKKHSCKS